MTSITQSKKNTSQEKETSKSSSTKIRSPIIGAKRSLSENDVSNPVTKKLCSEVLSDSSYHKLQQVAKKLNRIIVVIDETGSMYPRKTSTISAIQEFIDSQLNVKIDDEEEPSLTFVFFNTKSRTFSWDKLSQVKDQTLTDNLDSVLETYNPADCTALFDTLNNVFNEFGHEKNNIIAIFTDGEDNSSKKASANSVKNKIKILQDDFHWLFQFLTVGIDSWTANIIGQSMGLQTQVVIPAADDDDDDTEMQGLMRSFSQNVTEYRSFGTIEAAPQ